MLSKKEVTALYEEMQEYLDAGYSVVPACLTKPNKDGVQFGKAAIVDYTPYAIRLPTNEELEMWEEKHGRRTTGFGIVMGSASNLICADIDTPEQRIHAEVQHATYRVLGKPGRVKRFFRGQDKKDPSSMPHPAHGKDQSNPGDARVEWFYRTFCVVKGHHSTVNGKETRYRWEGPSLLEADAQQDDIEVFDHANVKKLKALCDNTPFEVGGPPKETGRFNDMQTQMGIAAKKCEEMDLPDAMEYLLTFDETNNPHNLYFADTRWHETTYPKINVIKYIYDNLKTYSKGKHPSKVEYFESGATPGIIHGKEWREPIELKVSSTVPDIDLDLIPSVWREWLTLAAKDLMSDVSPLFFQALACIGGVIGNHVSIYPKKNDLEWREVPNVWALCVAPSGKKKSPISRVMLKPVKKIHEKRIAKYKKAKIKADEDILELQSKIDFRKRNKKSMKHDEGELIKYDQEIAQLEVQQALKKVIEPQTIIKSITYEKAMQLHAENPRSLISYANELSKLLAQMDKKGQEGLRGFYLEGADGLDDGAHQTKTQGEDFIEQLTITAIANVQTDVLDGLLLEAMINKKKNDGFYQRFMPVIDLGREHDFEDIGIPDEVWERVNNIFTQADEIPPNTEIHFTAEARKKLGLKIKQMDKESINASDNDSGMLGSFIGKHKGLSIQLAFLLQFLEPEPGPRKGTFLFPSEIGLPSYNKALKILDYLKLNTEIILKLSLFSLARRCVRDIRAGIIETGMTLRDLARGHKEYFGSPLRHDLIETLETYNYIKLEKKKKSRIMHINPKLLEK